MSKSTVIVFSVVGFVMLALAISFAVRREAWVTLPYALGAGFLAGTLSTIVGQRLVK